jgi:polyphosphate kinase
MAKDKKNSKNNGIDKNVYESELERLQLELVKLQYWIKKEGLKVCVLFEGRDAAGKGGIIKRIQEPLNPRGASVVALTKPTELERTQWYFQRYITHLPAAGEIVIFDRSWYNRAGVEHVMGFCTKHEYDEFMRSCPEFEKMLVRSGIILIKYWITVDEDEQEKRFRDRARDPSRRWKLSDIDIASWDKWEEYSRAKDIMIRLTDIPESPWYNVDCNDKKKGRLNCIAHLLGQIPYKDVIPPPMELPERNIDSSYVRPPKNQIRYVHEIY